MSMISDNENKLVLATRIKQRWKISSMNTLIGNGEKLGKLFVNSRLILLERVRASDTNFLYAIAKCCSIVIDINGNFNCCKTLHHAVKIIETDEKFNNLRQILTADVTTSYVCEKCSRNTLLLKNNSICIYELDQEKSCTYAVPVLYQKSFNLNCSVCNETTESISLPIHSQVHHKCPSILMKRLPRTTYHNLMKIHIELTNDKQCKQIYKPSAALLIDEYNAISVIELDGLRAFPSCPYQTTAAYTSNEVNELFDTSRTCLVFLKQVCKR